MSCQAHYTMDTFACLFKCTLYTFTAEANKTKIS